MIRYSTNWMGPIVTKWYDDNNIPYTMETILVSTTPREYKKYKSYSCGRIDIYGLDEEEFYDGKYEYGLAPMETESWNILSEFLNEYKSIELASYDDLIYEFKTQTGHEIQWLKK
jgi:hypothetical protein